MLQIRFFFFRDVEEHLSFSELQFSTNNCVADCKKKSQYFLKLAEFHS